MLKIGKKRKINSSLTDMMLPNGCIFLQKTIFIQLNTDTTSSAILIK